MPCARKAINSKKSAKKKKTSDGSHGSLELKKVHMQDAKDQFPTVLKQTMGLITLACEKVGISRKTYYEWRNADPVFASLCDEVPDRVGDLVESKAYEKIQKGDSEMIRFYCKTKLKNRGYTTGMEITNAGNLNLNVNTQDLNKKLQKLSVEQLQAYIEIQKILNDEPTDTNS